ncbi:prephenate dehydrogenase [Treponema sp. OMZ 840]|uniref:prephenate dehydrogenase n=1 Tax=Treponema sp. OMZ 840 TaxID=244313 RepID=UPI003D92C5AC
MKVYGFVGLGLMGGSLAKAVRRFSRASLPDSVACCADEDIKASKIFACDTNGQVLNQALADGTIDEAFTAEQAGNMLENCDVVFICLYPRLTADFILKHEASFKAGALITDIGGVKKAAEKRIGTFKRRDVHLILGHPMAGSEKEGYEHSSADIFTGRNYIVISSPVQDKSASDTLLRIIKAMGFGRIIHTDGATHDRKIAFTSQLCHVIASALVDSAEDTEITAFGGGSYEDLTRIAMINAPLWTELFCENDEALLLHIGQFEQSLAKLRLLIQEGEKEKLCAFLKKIREKRIAMSTLK